MTAEPPHHSGAPRGTVWPGLLRRNLRAMLAAAGLTVLVQAGICAAASATMPAPASDVMVLLGSLLWVVVAAPVFAAGGRSLPDGLLRGGAVIDGSMVVLVVLVVAGDALRPLGAVKIYLLWCAVALAACAVAQQARRADRRGILATAAVAAVLTVSAGPFWTNGMILAADGQGRERGALLVIACNPVYATAGCLADDVKFVWNERRILYEFTVLGRDVPLATARWHVSLAVYAVLAVGLWVAACLRRATGPAGT